jgi:cyclic beta-1,2-glucan synthetase
MRGRDRRGDAALLDAAAEGIARLNAATARPPGACRFLLLHRRRVWSTSEACWMGWERKRGKLHELNRLLRGATDTTFVGPTCPHRPAGVRYVITLDADTRLPRDAVRRLVGKMAHPLNRPRFDPPRGRVSRATRPAAAGHAVAAGRPRGLALPAGLLQHRRHRPLRAAVSDVYQDLFGEGSYTGKGIYDVDAFEAALEGRVPEGTLLSHDLFEGIFARAGLASDIEVVEEFPARYDVAAARQHRWVRGDWQLLPWIAGRAGALPPIGRWKMLDNLRRSLSAPACVLALAAGWALPLHAAVLWTGFVVSTIAVATLVPILSAIVPRRARTTARSHLHALAVDVRLALSLTALLLVFLAHQAWLMADAIGRTLYRLLVSRRRLLDWVTAEQAQVGPRLDLSGFTRLMGGGVALGSAAAIGAAWVGGEAWPVALPFALAWIVSPAIARWTSLSPLVAGRVPVSPADARALRLIARRTWRYFEAFVTAEEHWLPPDNFQEDPKPVVAQRTSPTNIGVYLLSAASARDFGWTGTAETVERLEATLATLQGLPRFRGHFYNWYGTRDLRPLEPQYVSSVDSGNLAGHLIALANACREWTRAPRRWTSAFCSTRSASCSRSATGRRGQPRSELLRPAGVRSAARELRRDRQGRRPRPRHWFRLGRAVTPIGGGAALISWSGSMFEYLMPSLVMRAPAGSLLEQTSRLIVRGRSPTAMRSACPGASRNRPTTRATSSSPTSTRTSASPASA